MIDIAIVDDDIDIIRELSGILRKYFKINRNGYTRYTLHTYGDGADFVHSVLDNNKYNIVFMDVKMNKMDGGEAVRILRTVDTREKTYVIFISSHQDNLAPLFSLHPYEFFLKPLNRDSIEMTLDRICENLSDDNKDIIVISNREKVVVKADNIKYIHSGGHRLCICFLDNSEIECYMKLGELCEMLYEKSSDIIRIHASFAVNIKCIIRRTRKSIFVDGEELPISEKYKKNVDRYVGW